MFRVWGIVLRTFVSTFLLFIFLSSGAFAACSSGKLGTHRTIYLDASKHHTFNGREKNLGLRDKEVILTFDDGPIKGKTNKILDNLKANCVKATFFAVGRMARAYPTIAKRIVREGHTLAHHTTNHNRLPKYSLTNASAHVDKGVRQVEKAAFNYSNGKARTPFFRFPYLASSKSTRKLLRKKQMIAFGANIDSLDWKRNSPNRILNRIMSKLKKERKGIILMHDIHNRTVVMVPMLLKRLKRDGYKVVHIVPKKSGILFVEKNSNVDRTIHTASISNDDNWNIRKTNEIREAFIFDFEPIGIGTIEANSDTTKSILTVKSVSKNEGDKSSKFNLKKWALRSALGSL